MPKWRTTLVLAAAVSLTLAAGQADPSFVVGDQVGQQDLSSCQSYALAIALAFKRDPGFRIASWRDLRAAESGIRSRILAARNGRLPGADVSHADIVAGFAQYTEGAHTLKMQSTDMVGLGTMVAGTTGVSDAGQIPASFLISGMVRNVVLSSAARIEGKPYGSGHIFSILGVDGPPNSSQRYLVLNSAAARAGQSIRMCRDDLPDDAGPYTAFLKWVPASDIDFKTFNGKIAAWTIN